MRHYTNYHTVSFEDYCVVWNKVHSSLRKHGISFPMSKWLASKICRQRIFANKEILK